MLADILWLVVPLLLAGSASVVFTPLIIRVTTRHGLLDLPTGGRRIHLRPVPRLGGVAVFAALLPGLLGGALLWRPEVHLLHRDLMLGALAGSLILLVVGTLDDVRSLRPASKLAAQVTAALVAYAFGLQIEALRWGAGEVELGWAALPLTLLWIVGVTNAFNLIDGVDGLAAGIGVVALATVLAASLALDQPDAAVVAVALIGALLGFLRYNFDPARIFLGDSGSLFVGFLLAVLSVHGATRGTTSVLALVPLFALALPLLDTGLSMLRRYLRGVPVSAADRRHIHHQMLAAGLTPRRAVIVLYLCAAGVAAMGAWVGLAPRGGATAMAAGGGLLLPVLVLYGLRRVGYYEIDEAAVVLVTAPRKLRKIFRDRLRAHDLARVLEGAGSLSEVNTILADHVGQFQFTRMEVCPSSCALSRSRAREWRGSAWKVDYPVSPYDPSTDDWYVLRVWCRMGHGARPYGADRVAQILGPAIERWIERSGGLTARAKEIGSGLHGGRGREERRLAGIGA